VDDRSQPRGSLNNHSSNAAARRANRSKEKRNAGA
jgi:hypothetical protein